jgi:hypothetical protein
MNPLLADVLRPVKHVLLDFDGPVCSVFAEFPAPEVAQRLRTALLASGAQGSDLDQAEADPLALLRLVAQTRPDLVGDGSGPGWPAEPWRRIGPACLRRIRPHRLGGQQQLRRRD